MVSNHASTSRSQAHASYSKRKPLLAWNRCIDQKICQNIRCLSKEKITAVKHYGKIPLPTAQYVKPWEEVHLDLIGPWKVRFNSTAVLGKSTTKNIQALTVMDIATTCPEFVAIKNKTSHHIATLFDGDWLYRYPRPAKVVFDNGNEFLGQEFQELLHSYSIKPVPMTVKIPRSKGIIERVHLTMGDMLRSMTFSGDDWLMEL